LPNPISLPLPMISHIFCRCFFIIHTMCLMKCQAGCKGWSIPSLLFILILNLDMELYWFLFLGLICLFEVCCCCRSWPCLPFCQVIVFVHHVLPQGCSLPF
jgi:hypothetical protein